MLKLEKSMQVFKKAYLDEYGSNPPDSILDFARNQWTVIAESSKNEDIERLLKKNIQ
ncbi:MAG: hypothetical protein GY817_04730 [bacterium]|nr:hypothetical protein [bacterium]